MTRPKPKNPPSPAGDELTLTHVFNAPCEQLFRLWTDPTLRTRWWGPEGFTVTHCDMDVRVGGEYRARMVSPEGTAHWQSGVFEEILAPERLVFSYAWEDERGHPKHIMRVTVCFEPLGQQTRLVLLHQGFESPIARAGHQAGWESNFRRLARDLHCLIGGLA